MKINKITICIAAILTLIACSAIVSAQDYEYYYPDDVPWEVFGLGLGLFCIIPFIMFIIWIILAIWVYKDAKKRGSSGALWLLIVLITGIIGLIIWLVVRPPIGGEKEESKRMCPNCGRPIPMDARACPYCAKKFEE
ncbi:MAG: zinc ribbon domain-containing protein [Thermoplasmatota archaeon]